MDAQAIAIDGHLCAAWRVAPGRWHASTSDAAGMEHGGAGSTAHEAAQHARESAAACDALRRRMAGE